ncbi:hypothetical protein AMTR_s00011p00264690 [Amborella trichopoda]|uniref:Uncharacterized protein n=1 Tax=Amborella trichopoda TaxID=13333 RepID=W1NHW4_AMBTC|nr:hypothetical protein AMTR_s00011p00264690 [Amborella trichopoda]
MCNVSGIIQFMSTIGELARGLPHPSITPVWQRHLLNAGNPAPPASPTPTMSMIKSQTCPSMLWSIAPSSLDPLRLLPSDPESPHHLPKSSSFELLAACLWKCRTMSLTLDDCDMRDS